LWGRLGTIATTNESLEGATEPRGGYQDSRKPARASGKAPEPSCNHPRALGRLPGLGEAAPSLQEDSTGLGKIAPELRCNHPRVSGRPGRTWGSFPESRASLPNLGVFIHEFPEISSRSLGEAIGLEESSPSPRGVLPEPRGSHSRGDLPSIRELSLSLGASR
jgi:hypothetical protein